MHGSWRLGFGILGGLVLCKVAWFAPGWLTVAAGFAVAAAVGHLAGGRSTGRPAVDGAWAGAIAAGVAWLGAVGAEAAVHGSDAIVSLGLAGGTTERDPGTGRWSPTT